MFLFHKRKLRSRCWARAGSRRGCTSPRAWRRCRSSRSCGSGCCCRVGVGVGVGGGNCAQYLPPVFRSLESSRPPQTIIWVPLQIAVWPYRASGALVVVVAVQLLVLGLYLPPVPGGVGVGVPVGVAVGVDVGVGGENGAPYVRLEFESFGLPSNPPQTIISVSVQVAV